MLPQYVNIDELAGHLEHSDLYLSPEVLEEYGDDAPNLEDHYNKILSGEAAAHIHEDLGSTKFVVYPNPMTMVETRDIAQALKDKLDTDTVIVQADGIPGIISDNLTRGQIQDTQYLMVNSFYPGEAETFINSIHGTDLDHTAVNAVILTLAALAAAVTAVFTRIFRKSK